MTPDAILDFWFAGTTTAREAWFRKDPAFDAQIAARFGAQIAQALRGELDAWANEPRPALARLLLLDQFTRNVGRDTPRAFDGDLLALAGSKAMVAAGQDRLLAPIERVFVYLPFEHAEDLDAQQTALRLFAALSHEAPALAEYEDYARRHEVVIRRFGRFPHRNAVLGRASTADETAFLAEPGSRF